MNKPTRHLLRYGLWVLVGLALIGFVIFTKLKQENALNRYYVDVVLTSQHNQAIDLKRDNKAIKLVFFGFTHCPDICMPTLARIDQAWSSLPKNIQEKLSLYFITLDPDHDQPDILRSFLNHFTAPFIGLTGAPDLIKDAQKQFKVYASKQQDDSLSTGYTINHSGYIYLLDKHAGIVELLGQDANSEAITKVLLDYLN